MVRDKKRARGERQEPQGRAEQEARSPRDTALEPAPPSGATPPSAKTCTSSASGTLTTWASGASAMTQERISARANPHPREEDSPKAQRRRTAPPHPPYDRSKRTRASASTSGATTSITGGAETPLTNQEQIQCKGKPACGGRGGQLSTSQKRARTIPPTLKVPCSACGDAYDVDARWRYITNAPYRTESWRGARPGSRVCIS